MASMQDTAPTTVNYKRIYTNNYKTHEHNVYDRRMLRDTRCPINVLVRCHPWWKWLKVDYWMYNKTKLVAIGDN